MNAKKIFILVVISFLLLGLTACGNSGETSKKETSNKKNELPTIPKKVFSSDENNKKISKKEIRSSISEYLDTYHALFKNIEHLSSKDKLNKSELKKLNDLTEMNNKNDNNFSNYVKNNDLPKGYKDGSLKTKDYVTSSNQYLKKLNNQVQKINKNSDSDNLSTKDIAKIDRINKQYKKEVNGKKQKEVEKFLRDKNIKTKAFK
ncbi:NDxxF motif lipoprotein [Staphylococcus hsinchuensis]|uniref:NDxxF motif lipoprotein n=1 Tax=Staphylococcus hsinchuensis TaxID=3051183 RepID=A0ABZ3EF59_9STAP